MKNPMTSHPIARPHAGLSLATVILGALAGPAIAAVGSWSTTGPYGGTVNAVVVYEAAPNTLFAAGSGGVFRSVSSGSSWQRIEVGLVSGAYYSDIAVATNAPVLYLASGNRMYRSGNAGDLWVSLPALPTDTYAKGLALKRGSTTHLAVISDNGIYTSTNGGNSWSGPAAGTANIYFAGITYAADGTLHASISSPDPSVFGGAAVIRSTDDGITWGGTPTTPPTLSGAMTMAAWPNDSQRIAFSDGATIAFSTDAGATWVTRGAPGGAANCIRIDAIFSHPTNPQGLFVACRASGLHATTNLAAAVPAWTTWGVTNGLSANGVDPAQATVVVAHPSFPAVQNLWVGTQYGGLFRTTNGGASWSAINNNYQSVNIRALAAHPLDTGPGSIVLAGQGDSFTTTRTIQKSPDAGMTWEDAIAGLNAEQIRSIAIDRTTVDNDPLTAEPFTVYAVGNSERNLGPSPKDGGLYKSTNGGNTWTTIDNGIALVHGVPNMGTVRTIALDPRSCLSPPPSGPCPVGGGPLRTLLVGGAGVVGNPFTAPYRSARIYKSTDAGASWAASETGLPLGQELPAGSGYYAWMGGINPIVYDPSDTQTVYIGTFINAYFDAAAGPYPTIANGVFKSTDGGANWVHSSNGLPPLFGPGTSQGSVLAMAINPVNPQVLYAAVVNLYSTPINGRVYKTTDGGANWFETSTGIAGQDVRALLIDPNDPTGETIYAGTGGDGANRGGVYRSTNGGASWNSLSIGLPAYAATSLALPARAAGAAPRILAGTNSGVWDYTAAPDEDADGSPSAVESSVLGGDGNNDGIADAQQRHVASLGAPTTMARPTDPLTMGVGSAGSTIVLMPGACTQINDASSLASTLYPPDPTGGPGSHDPWGLASFSLPGCSTAVVRVTFHGAAFNDTWAWRNYGPRTPGDADTFGWYTFAGARRIDAQTWELAIDASRQGNYRNDPANVLFVGGPALLPDRIFDNGMD
ncbi:MAG TPA: hypothetical protein PKO41_06980 [Dokdonella sp.]|uniref:WD40/YVTN/BNR-like repeat-containing protein n=1 Tax=Dokdonella sp. TaxID=2291710 RepID=UPI0025BCB18E|nr:hypothetical protein [Dokdonella sp.]MBX3692862.1 hypothetical protein [Dokdonella sp.]HNR92151.1 hypothetical protein [Dokdonella sp.]